jgi:4-hydroxy-tetrahydrodipicolinate reductase
MGEMATLKLAVHGAAGRMGQRVIALAASAESFELVAALESPNHPKLGHDAGLLAGAGELGVPLTEALDAETNVVIDFSVPDAAEHVATLCAQRNLPLVVATTGLDEAQQAKLRKAAERIPIVWAPSMSQAVNVAMKLSEIAAQALADYPGGADVEIIERHHRFKEDAPSGTALRFGQLIAQIMGQSEATHGREGRPGARPHGEIGYHAVRVGDNPGEHNIVFGMLGETLEIRVAASNRDCYAQGALAAARFVVNKPAGIYSMYDVLGL